MAHPTHKPLVIFKVGSTHPHIAAELGDFEHWIAAGLPGDAPSVAVVDPRAGEALPAHTDVAGVIVTGYGTPPGSNRSYRATIYVQDPALDARSLKVALQARGGGAVPVDTQRAVEDAILTRARQLRIQDANL